MQIHIYILERELCYLLADQSVPPLAQVVLGINHNTKYSYYYSCVYVYMYIYIYIYTHICYYYHD